MLSLNFKAVERNIYFNNVETKKKKKKKKKKNSSYFGENIQTAAISNSSYLSKEVRIHKSPPLSILIFCGQLLLNRKKSKSKF